MLSAAQIGPLTGTLEALAAAAGAGVALGGLAIGVAAFLAGQSRAELGERALTDGYVGGLVGLLAALVDGALRYLF